MDILSSIVLSIRCPSCSQSNDVSMASILASQEMLNEGCACRGEAECPPLYLAAMLDEGDLRELKALLERLGSQAASQGATLRLANND